MREDSGSLPSITSGKHQRLPWELPVDRSLIARGHVGVDQQILNHLGITLDGDVADGPVEEFQCRLEPRRLVGWKIAFASFEPSCKEFVSIGFIGYPARDLFEHLALHHVLALGLAELEFGHALGKVNGTKARGDRF